MTRQFPAIRRLMPDARRIDFAVRLPFTMDRSWPIWRGAVGFLETTWTSELSPEDGDAYDAFVANARGGHYSQTRDWARVIIAGKPFVPIYFMARRNGELVGAALLLRTRLGVPLPFVQCERGPVCDDPGDLSEVLAGLKREAWRHGVLRLSVMPYWVGEDAAATEGMLRCSGFSDCQDFAGRHARTLRLDLGAVEADDPFAGLAKARREASRAERTGGSARRGTAADLPAFRAMHEALLRRDGKKLPGDRWYDALAWYFLAERERGAMFVCDFEGQPVSAIFVTCHGGVATYVLGASAAGVARFPKMILPMKSAVSWAKQNGARVFDLGGIPLLGDPDPKRANIAEFKYSIARTEVSLVHEHVRWF